jgi:hypothetical protein
MPKHWDSIGSGVPTAFTADSTAINAGLLAFDEAWTVIRMIGEYIIRPGGTIALADTAMIGVGIGVFSTDATATTAVPEPIDEPGYPWLYWKVHAFAFEGTDKDAAPGVNWVRQSFDIRSMRKVKPRESLGMVGQYLDNNGTPPLDLTFGVTRVLVAR